MRERLWTEAIQSDWQGDLSTLPSIPSTSASLLLITNRRMFERVNASGLRIHPTIVQRLSLQRDWTNLLDFKRPDNLAEAAAREGALSVLDDLINKRKVLSPSLKLVRCAAEAGQIEAVKWLRGRMGPAVWPPFIADAAAAGGSLEILVWLYSDARATVTPSAFQQAANNGHAHIIVWLADTLTDSCTEDSFLAAFENGHIGVLDLLASRYPDVYDRTPDLVFRFSTHLQSLEWIKARRPHLISGVILPRLVRSGCLKAASWLVENTNAQLDRSLLQTALHENHGAIVEWLISAHGVEIEADMFVSYEHGCNTDALAVVVKRDRRWTGFMADGFAASGKISLVEWMYIRYPGSVTQTTLEAAIRAKQLSVVAFLLGRTKDIKWDLGRAKHFALQAEHYGVAELIDSPLSYNSAQQDAVN
ncbi:hypothetical protein HK105_201251 [Polyrhizophydium stewartii]|uniref:Ankyrin repeat protein n=1 Tax=Polyrhizophydium stewartii TaxID=2732419 RepID=A0ABR4NHI9_9FUNG